MTGPPSDPEPPKAPAGLPSPGAAAPPPILDAQGLSKRFGGVVALQDASLTVRSGRVTCLLGDNGAGKSTLIKILSGVYPPTSGKVSVDGEIVRFATPRQALARGIATVYQDLAMIPLMSVWRNFWLGAEPSLGWGPIRRLDVQRCRKEAVSALEAMGIGIRDPDQPVASLSGGERQAVAIARALHRGARVLILDEPTAALGVRQSELVLSHIRGVAGRGVGVILVTHNPHHALPVGHHFVVLRKGRVIADRGAADLEGEDLVGLMSG